MTLRRTRMFASGCSLAGVAALAAVLTAPPAVADNGPAGSAYALSVATSLLGQPLVKIDPRPTAAYPRGGKDSLVEVGPDAAGLVTANALNASSVLKGRALISAASIADVAVKNILSASLVSAECVAGPDGLTGKSSIAGLRVLGQKIDVTVPGEVDVLGIAKVRVNEQIRRDGTLTVNAVHVIVGGPVGDVTSADIVLSQAKCSWADRTEPPTSTPPATTTPPDTTDPTEPPAETEPSEPTTTGVGGDSGSTTRPRGISKTSNDEDLAETGVSGVLPISLAGLLLLAGGGSALFVAKRKRRAANQD